MIIEMAKVRVLGPREQHAAALRCLQDIGLLHLTTVPVSHGLTPAAATSAQRRTQRHLRSALGDVESVLTELGLGEPHHVSEPSPASMGDLARWVRMIRRARLSLNRIKERTVSLEEERAMIEKYRGLIAAFEPLLRSQDRWPNASAYHVILRSGSSDSLLQLRKALTAVLGEEFELKARPLPGGETALLVLVTARAARQVEKVLAEARVQEIPVPASFGSATLVEAMPRMVRRLESIPHELVQLRRETTRLRDEKGAALLDARRAIHDRLDQIDAQLMSAFSSHSFLIEGWIPRACVERFDRYLKEKLGEATTTFEVTQEPWATKEAPVVLSNPRLFRPFEILVRFLPLPRYGTIDPTPFVAISFPMLFGLMVGDVGYGLLLAAIGMALRWRSLPGSRRRAISEIAGACSLFVIVFGLLYGELFGDMGRHLLGMRPYLMDREEAIVPFLVLAISIGVVHVLLGLGIGVYSALRREPRRALGRGLAALMVLLILTGLLAAMDILPRAFFTPSVIALLAIFPVLVVVEGLIAPIELLSTLGNALSYARVMALGTASVMLAVVANRMVGAMGSAAVGVLFGLLFHLVNFALAIFSPTLHALRLHYVEFFGKFYSPGGMQYRPFGHWSSPLPSQGK